MFLIQRLIGVGTYAVCAILFYLLIPKIKGLNMHLNVYCILLALMGFFYVPMSGSDLGRIQLAMHLYIDMPWTEIWDNMTNTSAPLYLPYYKLIGMLGEDKLLPFINAILTYSFCFALLKLFYKKFNLNKRNIAIVLFFFMSRGLLMMTIANIRTMLSLSIIAFAIIKILVEEKSFIRYMILMIAGALFHNIGMLATLLFLVFYIIVGAKNRSKILNGIEIVGLCALIVVYGQVYIKSAATKGLEYLNYSQNATGYFYIWEMILSFFVLMITMASLIKYFKMRKRLIRTGDITPVTHNEKVCYIYMTFMFFLTIISFFLIFIEFNSGLRLSWLVSILNMPTFLLIFSSNIISDKSKSSIYNVLLITSFLMLFIACARGDLCSLKFS